VRTWYLLTPDEAARFHRGTSKKPRFFRYVRSSTAATLSKYLPFLGENGWRRFGDLHVESLDRIRAAESSDPDHRALRDRRGPAQRVEFLGAPPDHQSHGGGRGCVGEPVQGDATICARIGPTTGRAINADQPMDADAEKYLPRSARRSDAALARALELLPATEFAQKQTLVPELDRLNKLLIAQQTEFWGEVTKPKASRRLALGKEYSDTTVSLLDTLDKVSAALAASVNHLDAMFDQLLAIKQIAWLLRNTAGEASVTVSNGLNTGKLSPELHLYYTKNIGGIDAIWNALQLTASGMQLPPALTAAMATAKTAYFRSGISQAARQPGGDACGGRETRHNRQPVSPITVPRMGTAVKVAEAALEAAKEHSAAQHSAALSSLVLQLGLLATAVALTFGAMMMVGRRVIKRCTPCAMHAEGGQRRSCRRDRLWRAPDEIGALAGALETFKHQAEDKLKIEAQERERNAGSVARQKAVDSYVAEFESTVRQTLQQLGDASGQMRKTSTGL